jgi:uncharacterized cupredoxin-like copper-binding protein
MKSRNTLLALITSFFTLVATAAGSHGGAHDHGDASIGQPGKVDKVSRTVQVSMADSMRFTPSSFTVKRGETIRFVVKNSGQVKHEFVLGKAKQLKEHHEMMKKFPEMEHEEPNMLTVAPGQTGELIWHFTQAGPVDFACLYPGHYDAGMRGLVKVRTTQ